MLAYLHGAAKHSIFLHILRLQQLQKRGERGGEKCMTSCFFSLMTSLPSFCPVWLLLPPGGKDRKSERGEERYYQHNKINSDKMQGEGLSPEYPLLRVTKWGRIERIWMNNFQNEFYLGYTAFFIPCRRCENALVSHTQRLNTTIR